MAVRDAHWAADWKLRVHDQSMLMDYYGVESQHLFRYGIKWWQNYKGLRRRIDATYQLVLESDGKDVQTAPVKFTCLPWMFAQEERVLGGRMLELTPRAHFVDPTDSEVRHTGHISYMPY